MKVWIRAAIGLISVLAGAGHPWRATAAEMQVSGRAASTKPKLIVVIVVDQLRGDYLTRFAEHFEAGGFGRLMERGAWYPDGMVSYGSTATAPGHASIASGRLPRQHGIVGNDWTPQGGAEQQSVDDPNRKLVGVSPERAGSVVGKSPYRLIGPTLGEQLKLMDKRSRVFSVAVKDRAAIFLGGHASDGSYWFDKPTGTLVTSTYYRDELPDYLRRWNAGRTIDRYEKTEWKRLLPVEAYEGMYRLRAMWLPTLLIFGDAFPHKLPTAAEGLNPEYYRLLFTSPYGNELVLELALLLQEAEKIGQGPATDLLCIGLSCNDYVGHIFGPQSAEVLDMTVRTDRQLAALFEELDRRVGWENMVVALTSDHGVSPSPMIARQVGLPADFVKIGEVVEAAARTAMEGFDVDAPQSPVESVNLPWVYVSHAFRGLLDLDGGAPRAKMAAVLEAHPAIDRVYTDAELRGAAPQPEDVTRWLAWRAFHPERGGAFFVKLKPGWYPRNNKLAGHTAILRSDRHVPVMFAGWNVRPGVYDGEARLIDVAPTLMALVGGEPPADADGRVLPVIDRGETGK